VCGVRNIYIYAGLEEGGMSRSLGGGGFRCWGRAACVCLCVIYKCMRCLMRGGGHALGGGSDAGDERRAWYNKLDGARNYFEPKAGARYSNVCVCEFGAGSGSMCS
jgi:hypothetical protein